MRSRSRSGLSTPGRGRLAGLLAPGNSRKGSGRVMTRPGSTTTWPPRRHRRGPLARSQPALDVLHEGALAVEVVLPALGVLVDVFGAQCEGFPGDPVAVSYTHLTLPTIYSV